MLADIARKRKCVCDRCFDDFFARCSKYVKYRISLTVGVLTKATTRDSASPTRDRERTWWRSEPSSCVLSGSIHSTHLARRSCKVTVLYGIACGCVIASFHACLSRRRRVVSLCYVHTFSSPTTRVDFRSSYEKKKKKSKEIENRGASVRYAGTS